MMIAADTLRAVATTVGGVLAVTHHLRLWELAVVVGIGGLGQALFAPAFGSIVPEIVPGELLAQANSLDQFVRTAAGLVGPAIAGSRDRDRGCRRRLPDRRRHVRRLDRDRARADVAAVRTGRGAPVDVARCA